MKATATLALLGATAVSAFGTHGVAAPATPSPTILMELERLLCFAAAKLPPPDSAAAAAANLLQRCVQRHAARAAHPNDDPLQSRLEKWYQPCTGESWQRTVTHHWANAW